MIDYFMNNPVFRQDRLIQKNQQKQSKQDILIYNTGQACSISFIKLLFEMVQ